MTDTITLTGIVGSDPRHHVTNQGLAITSFRFASRHRYFDRTKGSWEDGETNWYTVSAFRQLAVNTSLSVRKGERLVVRGRLRQREWDNGTKSGTTVEIEADSIGHDLSWCVTTYGRLEKARTAGAAEGDAIDDAAIEQPIGFGADGADGDVGGWTSTGPGATEGDEPFGEYGDADERTGEVLATAGAAD
ncbi:single-stranded DNA-binding protein [Agromyces sp. SYSU K20354]|uniref:single-stranded DNA-binding protein n=1 Tax=Agromyces cavernae TaxID=2898659 RepID=UPI001E39A5DF|nr:single-stranded DNA-binding protein [Agromyces cavernae]MCD2442384.1 single-stranded DNA-binding protein [Agromyces cavernae]